MDAWIAQVMAEFGIEIKPEVSTVLDVARDAAHSVARPAAPVTTFLMGVAVAQGADSVSVARRISELAALWVAENSSDGSITEA